MSSYGTPHNAPNPTVSVTLGPAFATLVNAVLDEFRATLVAKVTPSGLDMNADLSFLSGITRSGITNLHRLSLYAQPSLLSAVTYPAALHVGPAGELYYNDTAGNAVVMTAGGAVAGGSGDITSLVAPATVTWDVANVRYQFKFDAGANDYAHIALADLLLQDGSGNQLRLEAPAMAADYTMTLPNAVPATSNSVLAMATTGAVTATATPTVTTLTTTGAVTSGTTVAAGSAITAVTSITAGTTFRHGSTTRYISAFAGHAEDGSSGSPSAAQGSVAIDASNVWLIPIPMEQGEVLSAVGFFIDPTGSSSKNFRVMSVDGATGTVTTHETVNDATTATGIVSVTVDPTVTPAAGAAIVYAAFTGADTNDELFGIKVTFSKTS